MTTTTTGVCGRDVDSKRYWQQRTEQYTAALRTDYHRHRLAVIDTLIPAELYAPGRRIFDFGCGDAVHFDQFLAAGADIRGVDIAPEMIARAETRLTAAGHDPTRARVGTVADLADVPTASLDALLCLNVLAYLDPAEERAFYEHARRVVRTGGQLIVTHSNELFDLYSLNRYTVEFFARHLLDAPDHEASIAPLLTNAAEPRERTTYNVRENPLAYRFKLARFGFAEVQQSFSNRHRLPPALLNGPRDYPDTRGGPAEERWKLMFVCSTYGSRSIRQDAGDDAAGQSPAGQTRT